MKFVHHFLQCFTILHKFYALRYIITISVCSAFSSKSGSQYYLDFSKFLGVEYEFQSILITAGVEDHIFVGVGITIAAERMPALSTVLVFDAPI